MSCSKVRYDSLQQAGAALRTIRKRGTGAKRPRRAYPCRSCSGWHLTSEPIAGAPKQTTERQEEIHG